MVTDKRITSQSANETRRHFLETCGRFAVATPPAIALLLAATEKNYAVAHSGCGGWDLNGCGHTRGPDNHNKGAPAGKGPEPKSP